MTATPTDFRNNLLDMVVWLFSDEIQTKHGRVILLIGSHCSQCYLER